MALMTDFRIEVKPKVTYFKPKAKINELAKEMKTLEDVDEHSEKVKNI